MRLALAAIAPLLLSGVAAEAMPLVPPARPAPALTLVAGGCGMASHRGAYGRCRRRAYHGVGFGGPRRTTATGGNAGGYSDRN